MWGAAALVGWPLVALAAPDGKASQGPQASPVVVDPVEKTSAITLCWTFPGSGFVGFDG